MFFILSKTLGLLTVPSMSRAARRAGLVLLCTRFAARRTALLAVSLALFVVFGVLPVGER